MKSIYQNAAAAAVLACLSSLATSVSAEVVNFDDLTDGVNSHFFASPYHGLTFTSTPTYPPSGSWFWSDLQPPTVYRSPNTSVSTECDPTLDINGQVVRRPDGTVVCTGLDTESQRITSATPFRFLGAWFTSLEFDSRDPRNAANPVLVTFLLYMNNIQVGTSSTANLGLSNSPYQFLSSGYSGFIDSFSVQSLQGYFAMDDLAIPEPASYALVLAALSGLALSKRRSKH